MFCVLALGNEMKGDDKAGIVAGKILEKKGFEVIYGYETPANLLSKLKKYRKIIVLDAAFFEGEKGYILTKRMDKAKLTHKVGLEMIRKFLKGEMILVGIKIYKTGIGEISEKALKNVEKAVKVVEVCMAKPGVVVDAKKGIVKVNGRKEKVKIAVPEIKDGDFVLIHAGVVIDKISKKEYEEIKRDLEAIEEGEL